MACYSGVPLGIDDPWPQSQGDISRLKIDLFNGAKNGTIAHDEMKPHSTCIISANFATGDQQR